MSDTNVVSTLMASLGIGLPTAFALGAWLGSVWKERIARLEAASIQIDIDLRLRRIEVYAPLWRLTALLPRWPRNPDVTYSQLLAFTHALRDWYFAGGGMYLSRTTHDQGYFPLQQELERILVPGKTGRLSRNAPDDYGAIWERCSALRTLLAADIASRRDATAG